MSTEINLDFNHDRVRNYVHPEQIHPIPQDRWEPETVLGERVWLWIKYDSDISRKSMRWCRIDGSHKQWGPCNWRTYYVKCSDLDDPDKRPANNPPDDWGLVPKSERPLL